MQLARFEVKGINEDVARITEVRDGGGEKTIRREDCVIVPALDAETMEVCILKVAIQ